MPFGRTVRQLGGISLLGTMLLSRSFSVGLSLSLTVRQSESDCHRVSSSRNKLPFMILFSLSEQTVCRKRGFPAERCSFLQKNALSYRKNALSCRKMHFPSEKCTFGGGHMAGNRRKLQEGFRAQESRTLANFHLECCKWGFKRWGFKEIRGYLKKKAFFLRFLDFPGALRTVRKRAKKAEKGRFRPISGKGGQTPLKPPFVTPPFAAAQFTRCLTSFRAGTPRETPVKRRTGSQH